MPRLPAVKRFVSSTGVRIYRIPCEVLPDLTGRVYLLLEAGPPTLVDTGIGQGDSTRQILEGIETVRHEFGEPIRLGDVRRILLSHGHLDHFGGLAELVEWTGAEVGVHPFDRRTVTAFDERAVVGNAAFTRFLRQAGVDPARRAKLVRAFGHARGRVRSVPVDFTLDDGLHFDGLEIIHTPGHSPGHVCIRAGDVLLAGDHILARTLPQQWPESVSPHTGLSHYLDSLEKVRRLEGINLVLGGHEPPVHDMKHRIDEIRTCQLRRLDRLLDILSKAPGPMTIDEISEQMYSHQEGFRALLAITDVGARVEYLDQRGQLAIANWHETEGQELPVYRYMPATTTRYRAVLLVGPTGSGKTPFGDLIARRGLWHTRCLHFDFGDNLRRIVEEDRPDAMVSRQDVDFLRQVLRSGALLENEHFQIAERVLRSFLVRRGADEQTWIVLNGLPRHVGQAEAVDRILDVRAVIHLDCSREAVLERIRANVGGDRGEREDDDAAAVANKLAIYAERTAPLVDHYRRRGARIETIEVTATMTPEEVWQELEGRG